MVTAMKETYMVLIESRSGDLIEMGRPGKALWRG